MSEIPTPEIPSTPGQAEAAYLALSNLLAVQGTDSGQAKTFSLYMPAVPEMIAAHFQPAEDNSHATGRSLMAHQALDPDMRPVATGELGNIIFSQREERVKDTGYLSELVYRFTRDTDEAGEPGDFRLERSVGGREFGAHTMVGKSSLIDRLPQMMQRRRELRLNKIENLLRSRRGQQPLPMPPQDPEDIARLQKTYRELQAQAAQQAEAQDMEASLGLSVVSQAEADQLIEYLTLLANGKPPVES
jgi:hypothetical protein